MKLVHRIEKDGFGKYRVLESLNGDRWFALPDWDILAQRFDSPEEAYEFVKKRKEDYHKRKWEVVWDETVDL